MTTETAATVRRMEGTALAYCREQGLFPPGATVIAACSGGADSVALLLFLLRCQAALGITVKAAHVDHGIRGAASRADAAFVADLCRRRGVPLFTYDAAAAGVAVPPHPSEDWARRLRYGWFDALAAGQGACIATAHTMTDQAETLLLRLARGTGVHGMAGIPPRRGPYVRPFLCLTRADTEAYCAALGQSYVQDATNADPAYARNRLRHQALPALTAVNPAAVQAVDRFAAQMRALDGWLAGQAQQLLAAARLPQAPDAYGTGALLAAPPPVLEAALCRLLPPPPSQKQVALLCGLLQAGRGIVQLSPQVRAVCREGTLRFITAGPAVPPPQPALSQPALPGRYTLPGGYALELWVGPTAKYEKFIKNVVKSQKDLNCCADYDKISRYLLLRTRRPGDRFLLPGRGVHKTLKKYFNEQGVPPARRGLLPLLADGSEVLWLWGSGFAGGLAPTDTTATVLAVRPLAGPER